MTHPSGAARPDGASTLEHVAEHRDAGSRSAWELKAKSIDASAEQRQGEEVAFPQGLGRLAALVAGDDDARDRDVLSRRGDPGQVALVRATRSETRHDLVVLGDDVLDREEQVRERIPIQGHFLSHTFRTGARIARIMIDVIRCDEMVCDGEVPLVPDLLEEPTLVGLVSGLLFGHGAPSSQTTPLKTVAR